MNDGAEHATGRRSAEVFQSLTEQAGMTMRELADAAESHGLPTAMRLTGRAVRRKRGRQMVAARRCLVEHYERSAP
jgi:hypothetical protein